jgi:threonine dehydratase/serine racemase
VSPPTAPTLADLRAAATRIAPYIHRTPLLSSQTLDRDLGLRAFFKCENLQKVGAFKARGAVNAVLSLDDDAAARGVVTHSSGNHGQALAYAAAVRGIPCTVVMPDHAPAVKRRAVEGYGARVVLVPNDERETAAERERHNTGAVLVHPHDDFDVISGQGTAALEVIAELPSLDAIITPVGGGGLMSGTAIATRALMPKARLIGAEPEAADDAYRSLISGKRQPRVRRPDTIADGLLTALGPPTFAILRDAGVEVRLVSEEQIVDAARFHLERMKLVVEPSGATGLAALRQVAPELEGKTVAVVISGGNTDFSWLER